MLSAAWVPESFQRFSQKERTLLKSWAIIWGSVCTNRQAKSQTGDWISHISHITSSDVLLHHSGFTLWAVVLFSVCGTEASEETKTVNLLSKKRHLKMERRWQLKQISAAVWILATEQREKEALCISLSISSPSLSLAPCNTSTFMSHSLYFFLLPPPPSLFFSSSPSALDLGNTETAGRPAAQCSGGVNPLIVCHYPLALPTLILNLRASCLVC